MQGPGGGTMGYRAPLEKGVAPGWGLCRGTIYTGREDGFLSPLAWPRSSRRGYASGRAGARTPTPLPWLPMGIIRGRDGTRPRVWRPGVHGPDGAGSVARAVGAESGGAGDGLAVCVQKGGRGRPGLRRGSLDWPEGHSAAWGSVTGRPRPADTRGARGVQGFADVSGARGAEAGEGLGLEACGRETARYPGRAVSCTWGGHHRATAL